MDEHDWKAEAATLAADRKPFDPLKTDRRMSPDAVLAAVCERHRVNVSDVAGTCKTQPANDARAEFCGVARMITAASFPQIGRAMGKCHSTAHKAARRWCDTNDKTTREALAEDVRAIALGRHRRTQ